MRRRRTCRVGGGGGGPQFIGGKAPRRLLQHLLLVAGREIKQSPAIDPRGTRRLRQLLRRLERARGGRPTAKADPRTVIQRLLGRLAQVQTIQQRRTGDAIDRAQAQTHDAIDDAHCVSSSDAASASSASFAGASRAPAAWAKTERRGLNVQEYRSEEHTSELQSLMRISYAVFCLKKKIRKQCNTHKKTIHGYITLTTHTTHK